MNYTIKLKLEIDVELDLSKNSEFNIQQINSAKDIFQQDLIKNIESTILISEQGNFFIKDFIFY